MIPIIIAILLILVIIFIFKRMKHSKKKVILQVGPSLKDKGGMVTVMASIMSSPLAKKYNIIHIPTYVYGRKFLLFFISIFKIIFYKLIYRVELVHIHMASYGSFYRKSIIIALCKILHIKVVLHCHGACFEKFYNGVKKSKKKYIKKTLAKAEKIIVLSESWKDFFKTIVDENKIVVLYNSVNVPDKINRTELSKVPTGLFLGRIGERKGAYDLIEAVKNLTNEGIKIKILMAGDGEIQKAKELIKNENLEDNIKILGWIDNNQKEQYLRSSDFYILPSYDEGMPMSVLEAMSYSLPVITTNVGGIPEIIQDKKNGIMIKPGDIKQIDKVIKKIIKENEFRKELSENAYETILEKFNFKHYEEFLDRLYKQIKQKNIKVCLTSSSGGHFMQLKQLFKMTEKYDTFIFTEKNEIAKGYSNKYKINYLKQQERKNAGFIFEFIYNILKAFGIILWKNPDAVISTGAGATTFVCLFVKLFGGKVIYIESFAKINSQTITGKIVYKFADEFYVQWEDMKKLYPKAHYNGGIY